MAILVSDLISFARAHIKLAPLVSLGGVANEPGLTFAKDAVDKLLSPPYAWKWNRGTLPTFITVNKQQSYNTDVTDIGWLERAYIMDADDTSTPQLQYNLDVVDNLQRSSQLGRPVRICLDSQKTLLDPTAACAIGAITPTTGLAVGTYYYKYTWYDSAGRETAPSPVSAVATVTVESTVGLTGVANGGTGTVGKRIYRATSATGTFHYVGRIADNTTTTYTDSTASVSNNAVAPEPSTINALGWIFRLDPVPSTDVWCAHVDYQRVPPTLTDTSSNMGQIPDDFGRILRQLFLAFAYRTVDDRRYTTELAIAEQMIADKRQKEDASPEAYPIIPDESIIAW